MITFLFSAMLHEYMLAIIFRIVRPFFLSFIIGQVPLIYLTKFMQGKKSGAYLFWLGILIGPSIILSCYFKFSD
jgi:sterol O-acyltransferase